MKELVDYPVVINGVDLWWCEDSPEGLRDLERRKKAWEELKRSTQTASQQA